MSDQSPNLSLPYLQPSQAQKHVTHNEALRQLDALVQLAVIEVDAETPPAEPADGDVYALGANPQGVWADEEGRLALFSDSGWIFLPPQAGWRAWDIASATLRVYSGGSWLPVVPDPQNLATLGINTTADTTNRLAVSSDVSLFSHDGDDHRVTINKANSTDTASVVFQSAWSGRAEIGLTGGEDFQFRVSDDGSTFVDSLTLRRTDGLVRAPALYSGQVEIADDSVAIIPTPAHGGMVAINLVNGDFPQAPHSGLLAFDTGPSLLLHALAVGSRMDNLNDATLTGTTGTAQYTSVAVQAGALQIENRYGGARSFAYTFLNAF